jgi:hypothetical protein
MYPFHETIERIQCLRPYGPLCDKRPSAQPPFCSELRHTRQVCKQCNWPQINVTSASSHLLMRLLRKRTQHRLQNYGISEPERYLSCHGNFVYETRRDCREPRPRTILNHIWVGPESSLIWVMKHAAIKGKAPNMRLRSLYLPVRCIIHLDGFTA